MTTLPTSDLIVSADATTKEVRVGLDIFVARWWASWLVAQSSVLRLDEDLEVIWERFLFKDGEASDDILCHGNRCLLSADNQYLYACGRSDDFDPNLVKLDATDGTTVWSIAVSATGFWDMCLDSDENIILWGSTRANTNECLTKYDSDGNLKWSTAIGAALSIQGIAVDSAGDVYTVSGRYVKKYGGGDGILVDSQGCGVWGSFKCIAIDSDDNIYAGGEVLVEGPPLTYTWYGLFRLNTDLDIIKYITTASPARASAMAIAIDSLDRLCLYVASGGRNYYVEQWENTLTTRAWQVEEVIVDPFLTTDIQNRVHLLYLTGGGDLYKVYLGSDGSESRANVNRFNKFSCCFGMCCSRDLYTIKYTDQANSMVREDMCCFLDDTISEWSMTKQEDGDYNINDVVWCSVDSLDLTEQFYIQQPETITGIFIMDAETTCGATWPGVSFHWRQLSKTPPCQNANWDQYDGFGEANYGIGSSPQFYTITFTGLRNVSDGELSDYNGEYLLVKGPGIYGFFFRYEHDRLLRINFTIRDQVFSSVFATGAAWLIGDDKEKVHFGIGADISSVFKYESPDVSTHDQQLTDIDNDNAADTPDAICYVGTMSMYPGRIDRWDADTVWAVDEIVAWEGNFYQAKNENTDSEPLSGDWTAL